MGAHRQRGFTLIEAVVTLAIAAVLTAVAVPGFQSYSVNSRAVASTNKLLAKLREVRAEALRRPQGVTLIPDTRGWKHGWTAFDPVRPGLVASYDPGKQVRISISGGLGASMTFNPLGDTNVAAEVSFVVCVGEENVLTAREVVVHPSGHIEARVPTDARPLCA
jgi:prepilin-type N-terminal cleavage/methylation domain-containing protein